MSWDRQLDILVAVILTLLTFVGCIFSFALSVKASLLVSLVVFLATLVFGRRIAEVVTSLLGY